MLASAKGTPSLTTLRHEIEEIDRALVLLLAARVEAACAAIRVRSEMDGRLSDPLQEGVVLARAQRWAEEAGLPPGVMEPIVHAVLAAGKERFTTSRHPLASGLPPSRESVGIRTHRRRPARPGANLATTSGPPIPT